MRSPEKLNYERFLKYFHKHDQIYVGFRDGATHGYVHDINYKGVYLTQLNNSTPLFFDWDHFEVICSPGFLIEKANISPVITMELQAIEETRRDAYGDFRAKDKMFHNLPDDEIRELARKYQWDRYDDLQKIDCRPSNFQELRKPIQDCFVLYERGSGKCAWGDHYETKENTQARGILKTSTTLANFFEKVSGFSIKWEKEYERYAGVKIDVTINSKKYYVKMGISKYYTGKYSSFPGREIVSDMLFWSGFDIEFINKAEASKFDQRSMSIKDFDESEIMGLLSSECDRLVEQHHYKLPPRPAACGDPFIFEGTLIDYKVWKTSQGYCLAQAKCGMYF